jgi:hypothetical protein
MEQLPASKRFWMSDADQDHHPSAACIAAAYQDGFTASLVKDLMSEFFPESSRAKEPTPPTTSENAKEDWTFLCRLEFIRGYMKFWETDVQVARTREEMMHVICRAHGETLDKHRAKLGYLPGMRSHVYANPASARFRRPFTQEAVHNYKSERFFEPPWKKFIVWQRSILVKETRLMHTRDQIEEQTIFHQGAGATGGDPNGMGLRECILCEGKCRGR